MKNTSMMNSAGRLLLFLFFGYVNVFAQGGPSVRILLPERTRLLQGQQVDLVLEVRNATVVSGLKVTAGGSDITARFGAPRAAQLDCDASADLVIRADLQAFDSPGSTVLRAEMSAGGITISDSRTIDVRQFNVAARPRNVILF